MPVFPEIPRCTTPVPLPAESGKPQMAGFTGRQSSTTSLYLKDQLRLVKTAYDQLMQRDLPAFNALLRRRNVQSIIAMEP